MLLHVWETTVKRSLCARKKVANELVRIMDDVEDNFEWDFREADCIIAEHAHVRIERPERRRELRLHRPKVKRALRKAARALRF